MYCMSKQAIVMYVVVTVVPGGSTLKQSKKGGKQRVGIWERARPYLDLTQPAGAVDKHGGPAQGQAEPRGGFDQRRVRVAVSR